VVATAGGPSVRITWWGDADVRAAYQTAIAQLRQQCPSGRFVSHILVPGQQLTLRTLLDGLLLPSGNDAAEQVAVSLGGSRQQYVGWMNDEAAALGLKDTHFANPSGMDAAGHYSSAYDMAMLARYAMRNATFRELAAATTYAGDGFRMANLNRLLGNYPGVDGVKIGYTDAAQKTIVASAVHDGHRVYVSLMHSEDLPGDCSALFDWVWNSFGW